MNTFRQDYYQKFELVNNIHIAVMMYTTLHIIYMYIVRRVIIIMTLNDRSSIIGIMFILIFYKSF